MLRPRQAQPPLSLPQVDSSSDLHPPMPSSVDPCPPLLPLVVLDLRLPPALAAVATVVGAAAAVAGVAVAVVAATVVTTAAAAGVPTVAPAAPLHQLPARAGVAPPGRPSTTPRLAPSTCG
jgi:hypothetical protein